MSRFQTHPQPTPLPRSHIPTHNIKQRFHPGNTLPQLPHRVRQTHQPLEQQKQTHTEQRNKRRQKPNQNLHKHATFTHPLPPKLDVQMRRDACPALIEHRTLHAIPQPVAERHPTNLVPNAQISHPQIHRTTLPMQRPRHVG
jgi:hypothetical protein